MIKNPFDKHFKAAIDEIMLINGRIYVLDNLIRKEKSRIMAIPDQQQSLMGAGLSFRDITLAVGTLNLFMPINHYRLTTDNRSDEIDLILGRECLFQITQCYELLETYLYNQVTEFIILAHPNSLPDDFKPKNNTFEIVRKQLKRLNGRSNNKHLISILRDNLTAFQQAEAANIYDMDFGEWYDLLGHVRHCVTHNRMRINANLKDLFKEGFNEGFKTYMDNQHEVITLGSEDCKSMISRIAEFVFFIYKVTAESCLNVNVNFSTIQHIYLDPYYAINE